MAYSANLPARYQSSHPLGPIDIEVPYYHRNYKNDLKKSKEKNNQSLTNLIKRFILAELPILSLSKTFRYPISLAMDFSRTCTCFSDLSKAQNGKHNTKYLYTLIRTIIAITALAATFFAHPIGLVITTGHDIIISGSETLVAFQQHNWQNTLESIANVANSSLYLVVLLTGSLEILVLSLGVQVLLGFYNAAQELKNGNNIEGLSHLFLTAFRINQLNREYTYLYYKWKNYSKSHEEKIKELMGEEIFHFKGDDKDKFLILNTSFDWNGALDPEDGNFCNDLKKLTKKFDVKYCTVANIGDIKREIADAAKLGKVKGIEIRAHGDPYFIELSANPKSSSLISEKTLSRDIFTPLDPDCRIFLESCDTGQDLKSGIGRQIADASQRTTFAPNYSITANDFAIVNTDPLICDYDMVRHTEVFYPESD